jgi:hypothetical protein
MRSGRKNFLRHLLQIPATSSAKLHRPTPKVDSPDEYHPSSIDIYEARQNYVLGKAKGGKMVIDYLPAGGIITICKLV